ncbi:MAG: DedA family protein, partial [Actinomycetota bacterium]|nr:DedA family protein [Actinomycetota bacterium]
MRPAHARARTASIALVTVLAALYAVGVLPVPDVIALVSDLADTLGAWTYLFVPALAFLETAAFVGLLAPGETAVVVGGVVAKRGQVSVVTMVVLVWAAAVAGDVVSFLLGRKAGPAFLRRHGPRVGLNAAHAERIEALFARHGGRAILVGRFVGLLRAFTPFVAGASGLSLSRMLPYSVIGALAWAVVYTFAGYAFSESFESAGTAVTRGALAVAV